MICIVYCLTRQQETGLNSAMNTEQMHLAILMILVNLAILANLAILVNLAMRSGCGHHRKNISYLLASMIRIYIYWHKCSCYHATQTNEQTVEDRATQPLNWKAELAIL